MNVVNLRDNPSLMDIPAKLRLLADDIESGEIEADAVYTIVCHADVFEPTFEAYGRISDRYGIAGIFTLIAKLALTDKQE